MGRRTVAAVAVAVIAVAAAAVVGRAAIVSEDPLGQASRAPAGEAPTLREGPALAGAARVKRPEALVPTGAPDGSAATDAARAPQDGVVELEAAGALEITLDGPAEPADGKLPRLVVRDRFDRAWQVTWSDGEEVPTIETPGGAVEATATPCGGDPAPRGCARIQGLPCGRYGIVAGGASEAQPLRWLPTTVDLGEGGAHLELRLATAGDVRTLRLRTFAGGDAVPWTYEIRGEAGLLWAGELPADAAGAPVVVPARETLTVALRGRGGFPVMDLPTARRVLPSSDDPTIIDFEIPLARTVRICARDVGAEHPTGGSTFVWRLSPAPDYVDYATGDLGAGHEYHLPPGTYLALLAPEGRRVPRTFPFRVEAGEGTLAVDLPLPRETDGWRLRLRAADGTSVANAFLSLVQMDGVDATAAAWTVARSDDLGVVPLPSLSPGSYRVFWGSWTRPLTLDPSVPEPVLVLPDVGGLATGSGRIRGVVLEPDGRPMRGGYVFVHREEEPWGAFSAVTDGRFDLERLPPGRLCFEVPDTRLWRTQAPACRILVDLREGETRDLVLRPPR